MKIHPYPFLFVNHRILNFVIKKGKFRSYFWLFF